MKKEIKKKVTRRLKIIEGQVNGIQKMVEDEKYCIDIINQSLAVKKAISGVEDLLLENHLTCCATKRLKDKKDLKMVEEIIAIYKLSKNK